MNQPTRFRARFTLISRVRLWCMLVVNLLLISTTASAQLGPGVHTRNLVVDGEVRTYLVHVPFVYDGSTPVPLIIDFHGTGGTGAGLRGLSGWRELSETEGFIVLYPNALACGGKIQWRYGWPTGCGDVAVEFSRAMIQATAAEANINLRRVYASGLSNGAGLSHKLACEAADTFAAVAPVANTLRFPPQWPICQPSRAISVLHLDTAVVIPLKVYHNLVAVVSF